MKKIILLTLALTFSLNTFMVKKAEAGLIVAGIVMAASTNVNEDYAAIVGLSGMFIAGGASLMYITNKIPKGTFMPFYLIGLAADGSMAETKLVQDFTDRYNFINNHDLIVSLVNKIKVKYEAGIPDEDGLTPVNFSAEEVTEHFAAVDLTDAEAAMIKADLI